jgi:hypothetical protein
VHAVRQLAEYDHLSPDQRADRQHLIYLKEPKHLPDGTVMQLTHEKSIEHGIIVLILYYLVK